MVSFQRNSWGIKVIYYILCTGDFDNHSRPAARKGRLAPT